MAPFMVARIRYVSANTGCANSAPVERNWMTAPLNALMRYTPRAAPCPYVGADMTPPASMDGLPRPILDRPVCQMGLPVAGSSSRTEPLYCVPSIVVSLPGTKRCDPSQIADHKKAVTPWCVKTQMRVRQTGPADSC